MKEKLSIVKIGGNVIENTSELEKFLTLFSELEGLKILVHGGGKLATQLATKLGIKSKMVGGRRITDAETLDIITMVYAGLTNKNIVARLQAKNCNAIGLSGADGNSIQAHKRPVKHVDYGFAGDIDSVNTALLAHLLTLRLTPVFCAMSHDGKGQLLNTNADTIASELAIGLGDIFVTTLYYCFEKPGVLLNVSDDTSVVKEIDTKKYKQLLAGGVIADGMLPKLENCFHALNNKVDTVCLGNMDMLDKNDSMFTTLTL
ncbi:acetylglutamate kinase [Maribacter sp. PR1]|uniref:Acetylglutamate kinase n=1 Tax=Maribacter cobaltidurans TaxID=1178778 RepID=A0ABU7IRT7_9FLAO|nr:MULTISPECIES: acetylglutamate kinase [Maribacter]MDC6388292.1 acetylglutamate kinase [Maribacter sp. PR1]MEE1975681.1 acetylglutamate kinase [Maribacter cobaltidurans]